MSSEVEIATQWERHKCRTLRGFVRRAWPEVVPDRYVHGWHVDAICDHLEAVSRGEIRDLVISVPPGMSKSLIVSTFWPAWDWAMVRPSRRYLMSTCAQDLSDKNAKLHRDLVMSAWYQRCFGPQWGGVTIRRTDVAQVRKFVNSAKGWRLSTSVGGQVIGNHSDVIGFDDLVDTRERFSPEALEKANSHWFSDLYTRRADPATTARVGIAQRLADGDTPDKCIAAGYTALVLPMEYDPQHPCKTIVWWTNPQGERVQFEDPRTEAGELLNPARIDAEQVALDKERLGPLDFSAQMNQRPVPREGAILKPRDDRYWRERPSKGVTLISVDCAFKDKKTSDFVAIQAWQADGGATFWLLDRWLGRANLTKTIAMVLSFHERFPNAKIVVEDKANGTAVVELLQGEIPGVVPWSPGTDSKVGRAEAVAHLFEAGNVWLPDPSIAPWLGEYLSTLKRFPLVKHDDDVDATTMALLNLYKPARRQYSAMVEEMRKMVR